MARSRFTTMMTVRDVIALSLRGRHVPDGRGGVPSEAPRLLREVREVVSSATRVTGH
jgi:hypothetical protein